MTLKIFSDSQGAITWMVHLDTEQVQQLVQQYISRYTLGMQPGGGNAFEITAIPKHLRIHKTYDISEFERCTIDESRP